MAARDDIKEFTAEVEKLLKRSVDKKTMNLVGRAIIKTIQRRSRKGFGVKQLGGRKTRFKPLSPEYIKFRRRSRLDGTTSARKSNITFSGNMLRSLLVRSTKNGTLVIGGNRRRRKSGVTNEQLVGFVSEERPFLTLSKGELADLIRFFDEIIDDNLDDLD